MQCVVGGLIKPLRGFDWCNDVNPRLGPGAILIESLSGFLSHSRKSLGLRGGMRETCAEDWCKSEDLRVGMRKLVQLLGL